MAACVVDHANGSGGSGGSGGAGQRRRGGAGEGGNGAAGVAGTRRGYGSGMRTSRGPFGQVRRLRTGALVGVFALSGAALAVAPPSGATGGSPSARHVEVGNGTAHITSVGTAHLITGDTVRLNTWSDGHTDPLLLPGSPHLHDEVARIQTPRGLLFQPRLPLAEQRVLDPSVFNVNALAGFTNGAVPITVTFAPGRPPSAVPGLRLDLGAPTTNPETGAVSVRGTYAATLTGLDPNELAGIQRISLRTTTPRAAPIAGPTHTLTIHVLARPGVPEAFSTGFVENVDDSNRYLETPQINKGVVKLQVPDGDYSVIAFTFARLAIAPEFTVDGDTDVTLDMAKATVRPSVTVPGQVKIDSEESVSRTPARGFSFGLGFGGSRFFMRLPPTDSRVAHGTLRTGVAATFVPMGDRGAVVHRSLTATSDIRAGIPPTLSFKHGLSSFTTIQQHYRANGPTGDRFAWLTPVTRTLEVSDFSMYPVRVPSIRTVRVEPTAGVTYEQAYFPLDDEHSPYNADGLYAGHIYHSPGPAPAIDFAHGPVGPGLETSMDRRLVGRYCQLCRDGSWLNGSLPLFDGAGSAMYGYLGSDDGGWSLRHDGSVLAAGHGQISIHQQLPSAVQPYVLIGTSHPSSPLWTMSTSVKDVWTFSSGTGQAVVPILFARYLPMTDPEGTMPSGPTSFRLDFANLGPIDATVTRASVRYSVDGGTTWHAAHLTRLDHNSFRVGYANPAGAVPRLLSLRVTGTDAAGRTLTETALRAYRIRP